MKILHIVPSYYPAVRYGGPIISVHGLCRALAAAGNEIDVYTTNVDGDRDSDVPLFEPVLLDGVNVHYFPSRYGRRLFYSLPMAKRLQESIQDYDLVHLHSVFLWPTWVAARQAIKANIPYLVSPRGMLVKELISRKNYLLKILWIELIEKKTLARAAGIHVTSDVELKELQKFNFCLQKIYTIANGIDLPQQWNKVDVSEDVCRAVERQPYILFFGRINWKKGLDRLVRALSGIPGVNLVIAGNDEEGYLPKLQGIAADSGISDRIIFIPRFIAGADKEALYTSASVFVLPSYSENFGNTVFEAMIRSVPVVVTEEVGVGAIIKNHQAGMAVGADKLADAIIKVLQNKDETNKMANRGSALVRDRFNWEHIAGEMSRCYREILDKSDAANQ